MPALLVMTCLMAGSFVLAESRPARSLTQKQTHMKPIEGLSNEAQAKAEPLWRRFQEVDAKDFAKRQALRSALLTQFSSLERLAIGASDNDALSDAALILSLDQKAPIDDTSATRLAKRYDRIERPQRYWLCKLLTNNQSVGIPFLQKVMTNRSHPEMQVEAATLLRASSQTSAREKKRALQFLLDSLGKPGYEAAYGGLNDLEPWALQYLASLAQQTETTDCLVELAAGRLTGMGPQKGTVDLPEAELRKTFDAAFARPKCRCVAISGYASLGFTENQLPFLKTLTKDPDADVRRSTYQALHWIKAPWTLPLLMEGLSDGNAENQEICARAVDHLDAREALPALIRVLEHALEKNAFLYDAANPCCAAGAVIVRMAGLQGISFEKKQESFHFGEVGGWRAVDQTAEFRASTLKVLEWWRTEGAKKYGGK